MVSIVAVTLIVTNIIHKAHVPVPEALVIVCVGALCGGLAISPCFPLIDGDVMLRFEGKMAFQFMLVFISPIIFAEGYGMKSKMFLENLTRILGHAFLGTTISTVIVGFAVYFLLPLTKLPFILSMAECLAFGALISATDTVTTLAIFKDMDLVGKGLGPLYFSVLGESILNDAV